MYGTRLVKIILFGSYAKGTSTEKSDIDILLVLEGEVIPCKELDATIDIVYELNLRYGILISLLPVSENDYARKNSPLLMNVRKEGVPA